MKRTCLILTAGLTGHAMLLAQNQPRQAFQQADTLVVTRDGGGGRGAAAAMAVPRAEAGKPFSATATSQTTHTLADGTRVNQVTTMLQYRDAEGRVRTETSQPAARSSEPVKRITIRDTVAGVAYDLDPVRKAGAKLTIASASAFGAIMPDGRGGGGGIGIAGGRGAIGSGRGRGGTTAITLDAVPRPTNAQTEALAATYQAVLDARNSNVTSEDLGMMNVNGVPATGTRTTTVVPVGAIGNDREFKSVSERWFSSDLNLLVKSVSSDPRFGTTTYELTNISRTPPDPSLFRVPADYTIVQPPM